MKINQFIAVNVFITSLLMRKQDVYPTDTPPAVLAPLFAVSIIPGPPPRITTR